MPSEVCQNRTGASARTEALTPRPRQPAWHELARGPCIMASPVSGNASCSRGGRHAAQNGGRTEVCEKDRARAEVAPARAVRLGSRRQEGVKVMGEGGLAGFAPRVTEEIAHRGSPRGSGCQSSAAPSPASPSGGGRSRPETPSPTRTRERPETTGFGKRALQRNPSAKQSPETPPGEGRCQ